MDSLAHPNSSAKKDLTMSLIDPAATNSLFSKYSLLNNTSNDGLKLFQRKAKIQIDSLEILSKYSKKLREKGVAYMSKFLERFSNDPNPMSYTATKLVKNIMELNDQLLLFADTTKEQLKNDYD